jgi:hypothetical protein
MNTLHELLRYRNRSVEQCLELLDRAAKIAEENPDTYWREIQDRLAIGYEEACIIIDWLADNYEITEPRMSEHWVRCGRLYVKNNAFPSLAEMMERIRLGRRTALQVMYELQNRGVIRVRLDFTFEKMITSTERDFIRQLTRVAKKYRGRCEPELLMRVLYLDVAAAQRLSEYGATELGLRPKKWRNR